jgi:succinoglycan biosynthesis protein ExoA
MTRPPARPEPLVSVLMPVRNEQRHIREALESVLAQDVALEVLVVDARSTDDTRQLVESIGDPRVRILDNPRRVIPVALNIGLAHAKGRYVARVDGHMRISPDYLATGLAVLDGDPQVAAVGGIRVAGAVSPTGRAIATALGSPFGVGNSVNHYATTAQDTDHASGGIYRVDVARSVGGWDEQLPVNEDVDFDHRILRAGYRIRFDPAMQMYWRVRESLPAFARQYRRYGRGKAGLVRKNGSGAVRARHLVAPALVCTVATAGAVGVSGRPRLAAAMVAPYLGAIGVATVRTVRRGRSSEAPRPVTLAAAFATMHLAWGLGFLEGLLLRRTPAAATTRDPRPARDQLPATARPTDRVHS